MQTKVVRSNTSVSDSSSSWVDATGMSINVNAPSESLMLVTFSAESDCFNAADADWCSLRAMIGTKVGEPNEGTDFAWQGGTSVNPYMSLAMTRSRIVGAGTYTVKIRMNSNSNDFRLDDMAMVVQVIDV